MSVVFNRGVHIWERAADSVHLVCALLESSAIFYVYMWHTAGAAPYV